MTLPAAMTYGTVTGKFVQAIADSTDADTHPDSVPSVGTVLFMPAPIALKGASSSTTVYLTTFSVDLDATGSFSIELPATDNTNFTPVNYTWSAVCNLVGQPTFGKTFSLPAGTTVNITS